MSSQGNSAGSGVDSPVKSDGEPTTSPVLSRTRALEKLTSGPTSATKAGATRTPSSATKPTNSSAITRENEDLKAKLKVLERKRLEDREKMREVEKLQEQKEKFSNINKKIESKFQATQQENASLRKRLQGAEEKLHAIEAQQAEHDELMEMATMEREVAEETADVLQQELDAIKEKAEELELENEILREENAEYEKGVTSEDRASVSWIQIQKENERLRQALIKYRDIKEEEVDKLKEDIKGLQINLEDFDNIKEEFEICKDKLLQTESRAEDLREQLDNALGAEDMIEQLTEEKMNQGEEINELKAAIEDLEALKEINDELEINHVQNEKEMQQELDFKDTIILEQARRAADLEHTIEDMEYTLSRFRELVVNLQTDLEDMRASHAVNEAESEQLNSKSRAMMDLNMKLQISAAKTMIKTIDLELQRMDAQEAQQHLDIVKLFLPETYDADKNSVLALLRFKRIAFKANLLHGFVKERVSGQTHPGHEDDTFAACDMLDKLTWVASMCSRFVNTISHCSLEEFAKYEGVLFDLEPVERALSNWIDGLRREELKEKQCTIELSRTMSLITHLGEIHMKDSLENFADDVQMKTVLMQSHLESAATTFAVIKDMVQRAITAREGEDGAAEDFATKVDAVISQTRSAKVIVGKALRELDELQARQLSLTPETGDVFTWCQVAAQELADMSRKVGNDLHVITSVEGREYPLKYSEIQRVALAASSPPEQELFSTYLSKLGHLTSQVSDLAAVCTDLSQTQEFERGQEPWILRAQELKALNTVPIDAEEEIRQLKEQYNEARRAIAVREESLSTSTLRIETLEARMRDANAKANRMTELEQQILDAQQQMAKLKEDIEKQDRELKQLEGDRDKWKKMADDGRAYEAAGSVGSKAGQERAVATAREMDALRADIAALQSAVRYLREDNRRARTTEQHKFDWLSEPLMKPLPLSEQRRQLVVAEGKDVLSELLKMAGQAKMYDLKALPEDKLAWRPARSTPQYHAAKQAEHFAAWKSWQKAVVQKADVVLKAGSEKRHHHHDHQKKMMRKAVARLQIRLPGMDGKAIPGHGGVQIVGSSEWEALQGRVAVA